MIKFILRSKIIVIALLFSLGFSSCISYQNIPYFQDIDNKQVTMETIPYQTERIQKNDLLGIYISTPLGDAQTLFGTPASEADVAIGNSHGFLVDEKGEIQIPTLGKIKVEGLSLSEAQDLLYKDAAGVVNDPYVVVRILNFRITVQGEVNRAGNYDVPNGKINVLQAISMAGDLKLTGKRENIMVIRDVGPGKQVVGRLDMRSKSVFSSPFFYLENNDLIYVEPDLSRLKRDENVYRNIGLVATLIGALSIILVRAKVF